jgi:hypothetical protein
MIKPGQEWGSPSTDPPDFEVAGDDSALARAVAKHEGALIAFRPGAASDLARAVGLEADHPNPPTTAVPVDALVVDGADLAVNMVIAGIAPDRLRWFHASSKTEVIVDGRVLFSGSATSVVIANGQFLRGNDVVPRGHPGDGRIEVQVYSVRPRERAALRHRLASGAHLPHPAIVTGSGRRVELVRQGSRRAEIDGRSVFRRLGGSTVEVAAGAYRLLV